MKKLLLYIAILGTAALSACTYQSEKSSEQEDQTGKEYTSAYICPMHCEGSGSDTTGNCPVCKMDYVPNKSTEDANADHGHMHHFRCEEHTDIMGHEGDSCSQCGKPLTLIQNEKE